MVMLGSGNYLKTADTEGGDIVTFKNEGEWIESNMYKYPDGNPKVDFVIKIDFKGDEKLMRLNKTNRDILVGTYGKDTAEWVGKTARITKEKVMVAGEKKDCIVLEAEGAEISPEEIPF